MTFEWDGRKAALNRRKHRISFEEAAGVFMDPLAITYPDPDHSESEQREVTIGHTRDEQIVFVAHCERGNRVRIISARYATRSERRQYEEGIRKSAE
ncbi:MAG: BrnT family toxin [Bryobacteraceae bacterium]